MIISKQEKLTGWLLLFPALLILGLVFIYPIARAFWLSWFTENLGTQLKPELAYFGNYQRMLEMADFGKVCLILLSLRRLALV